MSLSLKGNLLVVSAIDICMLVYNHDAHYEIGLNVLFGITLPLKLIKLLNTTKMFNSIRIPTCVTIL